VWTVRTTLAAAAEVLARHGKPEARLDAELLLAHVLGRRRIDLFAEHDRPLDETERARFRDLVRQRAAGRPVAYLTGEKEFFSISFEVTGDVLIPRPDTETLVEAVLDELARRARAGLAPAAVADIGTGSGAIAVAVAKLGGAHVARVVATDASEAALAVAARNLARHALSGRIELRTGDLLAPLLADAPFDVIASNPPYVALRDRSMLAPEVLAEPAAALFSGDDGLDALRKILRGAPPLLAPGGLLALEVGAGQAAEVAGLARAAGLAGTATRRDLGGIERVVLARKG
jgi:release factor glutamine methyltransferase